MLDYTNEMLQFCFVSEKNYGAPSTRKLTDIIDAFNLTCQYLDDLLNIDNEYLKKNGGCSLSNRTTVK